MKRNERREFYKKGLSSLYLPFYGALCSVLRTEWQPYSGERSFTEQDSLYAVGRNGDPRGRVTNARSGESAHNYGCGSDWTLFDGERLLWLPKDDSRWDEYFGAVKRVGLRSGREFGDVDHNELELCCDWPHVLLQFHQGGMTAAQNHIASNMQYKQPIT